MKTRHIENYHIVADYVVVNVQPDTIVNIRTETTNVTINNVKDKKN